MKFKIIKCAMALTLAAAVSVPVFAMPLQTQPNMGITRVFDINDINIEDYFVEITREEFVQAYAENNNISFEEADILVAKQSEAFLAQLPAELREDTDELQQAWLFPQWEQTYSRNPNFRARMVGHVEVWSSGSFRQINNATVSSSLAAGQHTASGWTQMSSAVSPAGGRWPTSSVEFSVLGYFTTEVTHSSGANVSVPGFSVSGGSSTTTRFISDIMQMRSTFRT